MTITIIGAAVGIAFCVFMLVRNNWVYNHMQDICGTGQTEVILYGYDWIMMRFWKWNFAEAVAEFKASRLNPASQTATHTTEE
jgi:hypothetical protein